MIIEGHVRAEREPPSRGTGKKKQKVHVDVLCHLTLPHKVAHLLIVE